MFDYYQLIYEFVKANFEPTYPDLANVKLTNDEFLSFLFLSFPKNCISEYELNEILISLGFEHQLYTVERISIVANGDGEETETKTQQLMSGWCCFSKKIPSLVINNK